MADQPEGTAAAPQTRAEEHDGRSGRSVLLPVLLIAAVIVVPVAIWALGSGGSNGNGLTVQQGTSYVTGGPEIVVSIPRKYNTMAETGNKASVVLVCFDAKGKELFEANQEWPFIEEPGYPHPHIHQAVGDSQLKAMTKCTVRGMRHRLTGNLRRS
jgi:hypothetical protein